MLFNHFPTYSLVHRLENPFGHDIEGAFEEENTRHDANGIGGRSFEDQIVQGSRHRQAFPIFLLGELVDLRGS